MREKERRPATASAAEAASFARLRACATERTDRPCTDAAAAPLYLPASLVSRLKAVDRTSAEDPIAPGDVIEATVSAATAPFASSLVVSSKAARATRLAAHCANSTSNGAVDVDGGFAAAIMKHRANAPAPQTATADDDVGEDEW